MRTAHRLSKGQGVTQVRFAANGAACLATPSPLAGTTCASRVMVSTRCASVATASTGKVHLRCGDEGGLNLWAASQPATRSRAICAEPEPDPFFSL